VEPNRPGDAAPVAGIAIVSVGVLGAIAAVTLGGHQGTGAPVAGALPTLNAACNATSAILLVAGWRFVRAGRITAHRTCMLAALATSTLFLIGYLTHHASAGSVPFAGPLWLRPIYFATLIPHIVLSAIVLPLALTTVWHAARGQVATHRRLARWTLPLWLYVSASGVAIYWMLYRL
jgi:putative membrane protein